MKSDLINVGYGNSVNTDKIIAIISSDSAPARRMIQNSRDNGKAIDATQGRKTKSVIVMENSMIVLSALAIETVSARFRGDSNIDKGEIIDE